MGILNVGTQALQANLVALQTAGNNIANVNTPGYSRQKVILQTVPGQFTGGGYVGKGVSVQTIQRNFSEFLTRQATLAASTQASDTTRADKLKQLEGIFEGGASGLGASINDMMNAFSDVASAPTDLTARTVVLTRINETASRMRAASQRLDDLQSGISQEISQKKDAVNSLAISIAAVNEQIAKASGTGQPPNDLLDRRDQLIKEINQFIQTSSVAADDGTVSVFIGGSQALVLGTEAAQVDIGTDDFGDTLKTKLVVKRGQSTTTMNENLLGGGELSGLLRFQNSELGEGRNLLGRITLAVTTSLNDQHKLGLDLDGNVGVNLFTPTDLSTGNNILRASSASTLVLTMGISDTTQFAASDYELLFTSSAGGTLTRRSDNTSRNFTFDAGTGKFNFPTAEDILLLRPGSESFDGLNLSATNIANAGDRFLLKPYSTSASNITSEFSTPRALAVASRIVSDFEKTNTGSLQLVNLKANTGFTVPASPQGSGVKLTYKEQNLPLVPTSGFLITNSVSNPALNGTVIPYTPNSKIAIDGWEITFTGSPKEGDIVTVGNTKDYYGNLFTLNAGNATAMMDLRDAAMFDGAALTDGYAGMISQIGIRTQSANYAATVSTSIASNLERDRTGVSGVNLDEEGAKLLQYQQAYQASAKMIQIAQNIFDTLIQGLGR